MKQPWWNTTNIFLIVQWKHVSLVSMNSKVFLYNTALSVQLTFSSLSHSLYFHFIELSLMYFWYVEHNLILRCLFYRLSAWWLNPPPSLYFLIVIQIYNNLYVFGKPLGFNSLPKKWQIFKNPNIFYKI